jgi:beta-lactamase superfamily II metal-dependent hydrolase
VLRRKWFEWQRRHKGKVEEALTAAYADRSVYNLSSIVVLAEYAGKSMLLTGDARGDDVLQGLEAEGLLPLEQGHYRVDVLKLPHHGSTNNVAPEFFEQIAADHYVASGDQKAFPNPQPQTFEWIKAAREKILPGEPYEVWLTYDCPNITSLFQSGPGRIHVPDPSEKSITISLDRR